MLNHYWSRPVLFSAILKGIRGIHDDRIFDFSSMTEYANQQNDVRMILNPKTRIQHKEL